MTPIHKHTECLIILRPAFFTAMTLPRALAPAGERGQDTVLGGSGCSSEEANHWGKRPVASQWELDEEGE